MVDLCTELNLTKVILVGNDFCNTQHASYNSFKTTAEAAEFMQDRPSYKAFAAFCRPHAAELQTAQEVKDYIADGEALNDLVIQAKKILLDSGEATAPPP